MTELELLADLHKDGYRQGPGDDTETRRAIALAGLNRDRPLQIADIGCGTGASTLVLAQDLDAHIAAVDFLPDFLGILRERADSLGLSEKIDTYACSMDSLPFGDGQFDVIWSEGAIYNIGFAEGVKSWAPYLKDAGVLVVSEITWLTTDRPEEIDAFWRQAYPEIGTASEKFAVLEEHGYTPRGYFVLPERCWTDNYYRPLQQRFDVFLQRHAASEPAQAIVTAELQEIELYRQYRSYFSYGVYIASR